MVMCTCCKHIVSSLLDRSGYSGSCGEHVKPDAHALSSCPRTQANVTFAEECIFYCTMQASMALVRCKTKVFGPAHPGILVPWRAKLTNLVWCLSLTATGHLAKTARIVFAGSSIATMQPDREYKELSRNIY